MKKVILTIVTIATLFSCTKEESPIVTNADATFTGTYELTRFTKERVDTGDYTINLFFDCPQIWTIEADNLNKRVYDADRDECIYRYQTDIVASSEVEGYFTIGSRTYEVFETDSTVKLVEIPEGDSIQTFYLNK
jgi:hypothetical protein